ncbi:MAG: sugar phosphate isomerase/epimerase [Planctomycetes bacterium]|nr:sugar phosphate isomerase/epimerase [Planctomycetota bacterium]
MDDGVTRRAFVRGLAAAGLAAGFGAGIEGRGAEEAAKAPPWRMRLSTSSIHYMQLPIEKACERIAALGFEAIDIWSAHDGCPHLDDVQKRLGPEGLVALLAKNGLKLCAFSVYQGGYAKYAELLGKAGGGVAIQGSAGPCPPAELAARMRAFLDGLAPLADLAEKYDSYLAIENHGNALLHTLDSFKAFVDANRSKRIGIALAPYHLQAIGASVEEAIAISGSQLLFFYAWQRSPDMKQLPGHGPTDMTPWIAALAKIRYPRHVNPFMHGHPEPDAMSAALAKARDTLRACYGKTVPGARGLRDARRS